MQKPPLQETKHRGCLFPTSLMRGRPLDIETRIVIPDRSVLAMDVVLSELHECHKPQCPWGGN